MIDRFGSRVGALCGYGAWWRPRSVLSALLGVNTCAVSRSYSAPAERSKIIKMLSANLRKTFPTVIRMSSN